MTHTSFTGLLSRKKVVRYLIYLLFVCVFAVFVFKLNQVEKTELVVRTGQTFEKAEALLSVPPSLNKIVSLPLLPMIVSALVSSDAKT